MVCGLRFLCTLHDSFRSAPVKASGPPGGSTCGPFVEAYEVHQLLPQGTREREEGQGRTQ